MCLTRSVVARVLMPHDQHHQIAVQIDPQATRAGQEVAPVEAVGVQQPPDERMLRRVAHRGITLAHQIQRDAGRRAAERESDEIVDRAIDLHDV